MNTTTTISTINVGEMALLFAEAEQAKVNFEAYGMTYLDRAVTLGTKLEEAKAAVYKDCGHGSWLTWLAENLPQIPERTAQLYMQVARKAKSCEGMPGSITKVLQLCYSQEDGKQEPKEGTTISKPQGTWVAKSLSVVFDKARLKPAEKWKQEEKADLAYYIKELIQLAHKLGVTPAASEGRKAPVTLEAEVIP